MKLGATLAADGVGFGVYSETAEKIWVCLFDDADRETDRIALGRDGNVWSAQIAGLSAGARYGLRADGRYDPRQGYYFDPNKLLVDPYARRIDRQFVLHPELCLARPEAVDTALYVPKAIVPGRPDPVALPKDDARRPALIYELNVRAHTMRHPAVSPPLRGTLEALTTPEVIDHTVSLGVDVVELMPVAAWIDDRHLPALGLTNGWGYNPITYFAPDPRLAPNGPDDVRDMIAAYRRAGIRVVVDVVYNHTGESDILGPVVSMKGLDARTYYRHVEVNGEMRLVNDAGTGNTLQCDHPVVQALVIDSLRHWVTEFGVAGFRFDLATVLGRTAEGYRPDAEMLSLIRNDDVLKSCLLIAEPWDPGPGGYHVGGFGDPFFEWNDRYRDDVRQFWRGDHYMLGALATRLAGSADKFDHDGRKPSASVNFLAAHDGFTLADLVAFADKHNEANGENNRDGHGANYSWNCGIEGATRDPAVLEARNRDVRALLATLFVSHGSPMVTAGDEIGRSQGGNNNAYAQDNNLTHLDWDAADLDLSAFVSDLAALRRGHPAFRSDKFLSGKMGEKFKDVMWLTPDGAELGPGDWGIPDASVLGMFLHEAGEILLVWFNRLFEECVVTLSSEQDLKFNIVLASSGGARLDERSSQAVLPARSVVILGCVSG